MPKINWGTKKVNGKLYSLLEKHVGRAAAFAASEARKSIRPQPRKIYASGRMVGLEPSLPGEPPKQVTARLKQSITSSVRREGDEIIGEYGSAVVYARALELGSTSVGGRLAARPYLRPVIGRLKRQLGKIIATGKR